MLCNSSDLSSIGSRLKQSRENMGLTQLDLADIVGVKRELIAYWENGNRDFKSNHIVNLANALNVSTDYLLYGVEQENRDIFSQTGLTQQAIDMLSSHKDVSTITSFFLSNEQFYKVLTRFNDYEYLLQSQFVFGQTADYFISIYDKSSKQEQDILICIITLIFKVITKDSVPCDNADSLPFEEWCNSLCERILNQLDVLSFFVSREFDNIALQTRKEANNHSITLEMIEPFFDNLDYKDKVFINKVHKGLKDYLKLRK